MFVEKGPFGGVLRDDGTVTTIFAARVVIPEAEFQRLGLGGYERYSQLPACFRWCFDKFGVGGVRWAPELRDPAVNYVYFAEADEAVRFVAFWAAEAAPPPRVAAGKARRPSTATRH